MIAKFTTGRDFKDTIREVLGLGKKKAPGQIRVVAAEGIRFDFDEQEELTINASKATFDFRQQVMAYTGHRRIQKPVYHWSLNYSPEDTVTDEQMAEDAHDFLNRTGFGNTQQLMVVHRDKTHPFIHIVTNIVDNEGKRIDTYKLGPRATRAAADITQEIGYAWGKKREPDTEDNAYKPRERAKHAIEPVIRECLSRATTMDEFAVLLKEKGISCMITPATAGRRAGISYAIEFEGQLHKFRGASVRYDLSYGHVEKEIKANAAGTGNSNKAARQDRQAQEEHTTVQQD